MRSLLFLTLTLIPLKLLALEPPDLAPLRRFYNTESSQHWYSVNPREIEYWRGWQRLDERGIVGRVATRPLPGTTRLYRALRTANQRHFYYTTASPLHEGVTRKMKEFEAYVWTQPGDGRIGIYRSTLTDGTDVYYDRVLENVKRYRKNTKVGRGVDRRFAGPAPVFYVYPLEKEPQETARPAPTANVAQRADSSMLNGVLPSAQPDNQRLSSPSMKNSRAGASAEDLADVIERCEKSVVRIEVETAEGKSLGSGFVIANKMIATNVHVLAGAQSATAIFPDQREFQIDGVLTVDPRRDIAIATLRGVGVEQLPVLRFAENMPRKGERVFALGSPLGLSFSASVGVVSAIRPGNDLARELGKGDFDGTWIQVDAALSPGNSGGPLIDNHGFVVAMSTLASQGAQNLNFGISGIDVERLMKLAHTSSVTSLAESMEHLKRDTRDRPMGGAPRQEVPREAVQAYVDEGYENHADIRRNLVREISRLRTSLREMRAGETSIPAELRRQNRDADIIRATDGSRRGLRKWFFLNQQIKDETINLLLERLKTLTKINLDSNDKEDQRSLFTLLWQYGPSIDTRKDGSVGFMSEAVVINALDAHHVLILFEEALYLLYLDSTAGLTPGREVTASPVFVNGTTTAALPEGGTTSVTVLQAVSEEALKAAVNARTIAAASDSLPSEFRTWTDQTGKFSVDAQLIQMEGDDVELRRRDGKSIRVPIQKLSDADQRRLRE